MNTSYTGEVKSTKRVVKTNLMSKSSAALRKGPQLRGYKPDLSDSSDSSDDSDDDDYMIKLLHIIPNQVQQRPLPAEEADDVDGDTQEVKEEADDVGDDNLAQQQRLSEEDVSEVDVDTQEVKEGDSDSEVFQKEDLPLVNQGVIDDEAEDRQSVNTMQTRPTRRTRAPTYLSDYVTEGKKKERRQTSK